MQNLIERFGASIAVSFALGLLLALVILPVASAQSITDTTNNLTERVETRSRDVLDHVDSRRQEVQQKVAERKEQVESRFIGKKLELCKKREAKIAQLMTRISTRGERHLDVFTKIDDRTRAYYTSKNLSVSNYDELTATVDEKRLMAEKLVSMTGGHHMFTCEIVNPYSEIQEFKQHTKEQITALQEYRTAIKNLIVAVKTARAESTPAGATN